MDQKKFDEDYNKSVELYKNGDFKGTINLLLEYKKEFDKFLDENQNCVSFSDPFEKALYMEFFAKTNSDFKVISPHYNLLYNNFASSYLGLGDEKNALEICMKMMKVAPTDFIFNYNVATICIHKRLQCLSTIIQAMTNAFKFALNKEDLASILELYGIDFIGNSNPEIAYICSYRANQLSPSKKREKAANYYSQFVKASKLSNFNVMRQYAQKYNFAVDFNSRVKKLAYNCACSEYSRKNKYGVKYFLEILANVDDKYKNVLDDFENNKAILETKEEPINTYYNEYYTTKLCASKDEDMNFEDHLKNVKSIYKELIDDGYSKKEVVSKLVQIYNYDNYDYENEPCVTIYYFYDCLNLTQPKQVMDHLQIERNQFFEKYKIDEYIKTYQEKYNYNKQQAIGYLIYNWLANYFIEKIDLYELVTYCLYLGYHLPSSFVKKSVKSKKKSDIILLDDYGNKYQMLFKDHGHYDDLIILD